MNGIVITAIICFTVLLIAGMWKSDKDQHRALIRELSTQAPPDQVSEIRADIRRQAGLS